MTNNPREQAIEKLADILKRNIKITFGIFNTPWIANENEAAEAILDALNVEVVSKENGVSIGDMMSNGSYWHCFDKSHGKNTFIALRNNKPAVYVENIGVKL